MKGGVTHIPKGRRRHRNRGTSRHRPAQEPGQQRTTVLEVQPILRFEVPFFLEYRLLSILQGTLDPGKAPLPVSMRLESGSRSDVTILQ